jgi:glyoxylase-like metal-dependent hydrolase (beta-lactamase superfamily II)
MAADLKKTFPASRLPWGRRVRSARGNLAIVAPDSSRERPLKLVLRFGLVAFAVASLAGSAGAITGPKPEFRKIADGVYAYIGKLNDANALAIVTNEGVVIADTGNNTTDARELLNDIKSVTSQPVRYVVITQNHGDHVGGTPLFSPPATVIVHERAAKLWAGMKPYQINSWRKRFPERAEAL